MFIILLISALIHHVNLQQSTSGTYIETVTASGCESCPIYLTCKHFTSIIAILEATFLPDFINNTTTEFIESTITSVSSVFEPPHPRHCLNRRCSGINHCSFVLTEDCPWNYWENGTLLIRYVCIPETRIVKYCNRDIQLPHKNNEGISEGFIRNPGYPRFYGGQTTCKWKIKAPSEQKILLTILDISLIVDNPRFPEDCTWDHLEILDSDSVIYSSCKEEEQSPSEIFSLSETVEIVLKSSKILSPKRGILLHYTAVGCPVPLPPADSYLVFINDTFAVFSCCVGYVFPDTGTRSRQLYCKGSKWSENMPLPNCEELRYEIDTEILPEFSRIMASDVVTPAILIAALFIVNSIVLFYIYKAKQRNDGKLKDEEIGALSSIELSPVET